MIGSTVKMRGLDQELNKSTLYVFIQLALHIFIYVSCMVDLMPACYILCDHMSVNTRLNIHIGH